MGKACYSFSYFLSYIGGCTWPRSIFPQRTAISKSIEKLSIVHCAKCAMMSSQWKTTSPPINVRSTSVWRTWLGVISISVYLPGAMGTFHLRTTRNRSRSPNWSIARQSNMASQHYFFCLMTMLSGHPGGWIVRQETVTPGHSYWLCDRSFSATSLSAPFRAKRISQMLSSTLSTIGRSDTI